MDKANQVQRMPPSSHVGKVLRKDVCGFVLSGAVKQLKNTLFVRIVQPRGGHTMHPPHVAQRGVLASGYDP